jgi:predicted phosphodiesterase
MIEKDKDWQHNAIALDKVGLMSGREIAEALGVPKSTLSDFLRSYRESLAEPGPDNSRILFISDMHIPYHHEHTLLFLESLKRRYEPTRIICLGDELDKHAMSFHDSDPDLPSAGDELRRALPVVKELEALFPVMDLIDSNHGSMVYRKSKAHGIPRSYIRSYNEVLEVGDGWKWHNDLTIELPDGQKVYVHHGKSADAVKTSQAMSMSHVCGHFHESFAIKYWANPNGLFWAMNSGCLIDDRALAFSYNNVNLKRPIVGTSLIIDGYPVLEAMPL